MTKPNSLSMLHASKRRSVKSATQDLVRTEDLYGNTSLPLVVYPNHENVDLVTWAQSSHTFIKEKLLKHGCLLFRDFHLADVEQFQQFIQNSFPNEELLSYLYRSTPRTQVSGKIYTSTEYPADTPIPLHHESAYARTWPMRIIFYAVQPSPRGGETPVADGRRIYQKMDPKIRENFEKKGILYVRNYAKLGLDLSWQEAFQTEDPEDVVAFCREAGLDYEWRGDSLRTKQICQGSARHPETGEMSWFNQAHLFHISGLKNEVREALLADREPEDLPRNSYYGDGSVIEDSVMDEIRGVMESEKVTFPWNKGDIMIMENMLAAHGRNAFKGERKVLAAMVTAMNAKDLPV